MMIITLLVSEINKNNYITPNQMREPRDPDDYTHPHQKLLRLYSSHDRYNVIRLAEYLDQPNPFYVINMGNYGDFRNLNLWSLIPKEDIKILTENKIPILLWFPLEGPDHSTIDEWKNVIEAKNSVGLTDNKMFVLTVSPVLEQNYKNPVLHLGPNSELDNTEFILSVNYCIQFGNYALEGSKYTFFDGARHNCCKITDHDFNRKKYNFLCLNHLIHTRFNRLLLLQSLYCANSPFKDNIISAIWGDLSKSNPLLYDTNAKKQKFYEDLVIFMSNHDKKITNDKSLIHLIEILEELNIYNFADYTKLKKIEKSNLSESALFLYNLIIDSLNEDIFPVQYLSDTKKIDRNRSKNFGNFNISWDKQWYIESWFSIITESWDYNDNQQTEHSALYFPMLSEKTIKAIINHHPFIIFGSPGCNNVLEKYNFRRFDQTLLGLPEEFSIGNLPFIEKQRLFIEALERFSEKSHAEKVSLWNKVEKDIIHNFEVLMNTDWIEVQYNLMLESIGHNN